MFVWVRFGDEKELVNTNCTGYCFMDHIVHLYSGNDILSPSSDENWPNVLVEFDLADESGYVIQLNRNLGDMVNTILMERETYVLIRAATGDDGKTVYIPLVDQEDEPFQVRDAVRPRGAVRQKKPAERERARPTKDTTRGGPTPESLAAGAGSTPATSARGRKTRQGVY